VANVAEAGDIVLFAIVLGATLAVGLALLAIDAVAGRIRRGRGAHRRSAS
jgi:hypothetical protein